jgi:hypothetical protein
MDGINQSTHPRCHCLAAKSRKTLRTCVCRRVVMIVTLGVSGFVRGSPFAVHRSLFRVFSACQFACYFLLGFACLAFGQEANSETGLVEVDNPFSPGDSGFSGANQLTSPPSGIAISPGHNKISASDLGGSVGAIALSPDNSKISGSDIDRSIGAVALSPDNTNISTNSLGESSGANQMTPPPLGSGAQTGSASQELPAATREAGDKKWLLLFNFSTGVTYDDNIFITNQNKQADEIFTVAGGFTLGLGDYRNLQENYLLAQYLLTGFFFVHNSQEDAPNQDFALKTQFRFSKLTLQTQTRYEYLTGVNRQVGNFVNQNLIDNLVRLSYDYSDKTQFFASFEQITDLYQDFLSSYEYIGRLGGEYQITPKIRLGGEAVFGELDQEASPSSTYAQLRLLADYDLTGKLSLHLSAGGEIRHYDSPGGGLTKGTPVFSLGLSYHPFPDTSIGLTGYRNVNASPSAADEDFVATGVAVQLSQLVFQRVTVGIAAGYENDQYLATEVGASEIGRVDNYFFIQPSLTYRFRSWLSASLSYEFRRNASNESGFTFSDNRTTFSIGVNF